MNPLDRIHAIYAAFGRGDIPAILDHLEPDVEWEYGAPPAGIPWLKPRTGHLGAREFFEELATGMHIERFAPKQFLAAERLVVVLLDIEFVVLSTGKRVVEVDEVHLWHLGADGRVCRFRHRLDTALQAAACR